MSDDKPKLVVGQCWYVKFKNDTDVRAVNIDKLTEKTALITVIDGIHDRQRHVLIEDVDFIEQHKRFKENKNVVVDMVEYFKEKTKQNRGL